MKSETLNRHRMKLTKAQLVKLVSDIEGAARRQTNELHRQLGIQTQATIDCSNKITRDSKEIGRLQKLLGKYIDLTARLRDEKSNLLKTVKAQSEIIGMLAETADRYNPVDVGNYEADAD